MSRFQGRSVRLLLSMPVAALALLTACALVAGPDPVAGPTPDYEATIEAEAEFRPTPAPTRARPTATLPNVRTATATAMPPTASSPGPVPTVVSPPEAPALAETATAPPTPSPVAPPALTSTPAPSPTPLATATPAPTPTATPQPPWTTYQNPEFGYSIRVAPGWKVHDAATDSVFIASPDKHGSAGLYIFFLGETTLELEAVADQVMAHRESETREFFELGSRSRVALDSGIPAVRAEYRERQGLGSCTTHATDVFVLAGTRAFELLGVVCEGDLARRQADLEGMQGGFSP